MDIVISILICIALYNVFTYRELESLGKISRYKFSNLICRKMSEIFETSEYISLALNSPEEFKVQYFMYKGYADNASKYQKIVYIVVVTLANGLKITFQTTNVLFIRSLDIFVKSSRVMAI
jgi:hypothetical protein